MEIPTGRSAEGDGIGNLMGAMHIAHPLRKVIATVIIDRYVWTWAVNQ